LRPFPAAPYPAPARPREPGLKEPGILNLTLFGASGALGGECLKQALEAGHHVTALLRNPDKLPADLRGRISVIKGDALDFEDVRTCLPQGTDAILFAIGVDEKTSPPDLCTDVTRHILQVMRERQIPRLVWCGGGSNLLPDDQISFGARFVRWYGETFLKHRHDDKVHQLELLHQNTDLRWIGIRPLQMVRGPRRARYRLGYDKFSGLSKITFADCAHAMIEMLIDDTWIGKAPIVQY
jgi:putative NADH-flavin reductase